MFSRRKSAFQRFFLNQYLVLIMVFVLLILISIPLARNVSKKYAIDSEIKALEDEIIGLQKKNLEMEKLIKDYNSSDFVEGIARLNLGLKREGEEVLVIKKDAKSEVTEIDYDIKFAGDIEESNPKKWLKYFLKN